MPRVCDVAFETLRIMRRVYDVDFQPLRIMRRGYDVKAHAIRLYAFACKVWAFACLAGLFPQRRRFGRCLVVCSRLTGLFYALTLCPLTCQALRTVRDGKLYREAFGTFDQFVLQQCKMHPSTAYRLMDGEAAIQNVAPGPHFEVIPEKQLRALTKLDPDQQRSA